MNFDCILWFIRCPLLLLFTIAVYIFHMYILLNIIPMLLNKLIILFLEVCFVVLLNSIGDNILDFTTQYYV